MPSGAKKRKAAKKKKEKVASNSPSTTSSTQGDEDLKHHESDGDHNSEGEEEEVAVKSVEGSKSVDDVKYDDVGVENRAAEEEGVVRIERESKQNDDESNKLKGGSSRSSSSSGSDDESYSVGKDIVVIDEAPVVQSVDSLPEEVNHTTPVSKLDGPAEESVPDAGTEEVSLLADVSARSRASADNSLSSGEVEAKENGVRELSSVEENARLPEVEEVLAHENKQAAGPSVVKKSAAHEDEDKLLVSYNARRDDAMEDSTNVKVSEALGSSEPQPLIASSAQPVQATSWKSCCGLFEVFSGANR